MSRIANRVYNFARQVTLGIDTAHAVFHGVPVSDRARRACAPGGAGAGIEGGR